MEQWRRKLVTGVVLLSLAEAGIASVTSRRAFCDETYFKVKKWGYWSYPEKGKKLEASVVMCVRQNEESSVYTRDGREFRVNGDPYLYDERNGFTLISYTHPEESDVLATTAIFDSNGNLWNDSEATDPFSIWDLNENGYTYYISNGSSDGTYSTKIKRYSRRNDTISLVSNFSF